jgi:hypothetical protein
METEKKRRNDLGHPDHVKDLEFMLGWSLCRQAEEAKFEAIKNLTRLTEPDIGALLGVSQSAVSKRWKAACDWLSGCLKQRHPQGI